ncbi:hypothetical protein K439DRAFT_50908 [Ramaria rubella]|nr:hypothetical protein K439DRAFT_50908 [Ramaria rubella]
MASGDVNSTFGALLIGLLFAAFLFGTLTLQTYLYFRKFWRDPVLLKVVVMALWSLNTLQMCFISSAQYKYVVTNFLGLLSDNSQAWTETIHLTVTAVITFIVQCFFVTRLWFLSGKSVLLIIGIIPLMVARLAIGITTTAITIRIGNYNSADPERGWMIACLASPLPMNVFITATLAYFVHRRRPKINLKNTLTLLDTFVLYSLHTALLPCIISVASLICYVSMENSLVFVAVHYILGELYTSCMLVVLNARKSSQAGPSLGWLAAVRSPVSPTRRSPPTVLLSISQPIASQASSSEASASAAPEHPSTTWLRTLTLKSRKRRLVQIRARR